MAEPRSLQVRYRRRRPSVPAARAKARAVAFDWRLPPHVADSLEWVVTELVTNAVIHGRATRGTYVLVAYHLDDDLLRVEVRDAATGTPNLILSDTLASDLALSGCGLKIVAALSESWGVTQRVIGKTVWAELAMSSKEDEPHDR
ncbi:ATP-binding protein [Streptomyces sp. cg40]|uniref:ATP-binding protein n=1 Tax=Streptomyces sp. cg40 TaxID=3419764 RepID=UPI003D0868F3